jgi:hypothetical protein
MKASTQFDYARLSQRLWFCVGVAIVATLASFGLSLLTEKLHARFTAVFIAMGCFSMAAAILLWMAMFVVHFIEVFSCAARRTFGAVLWAVVFEIPFTCFLLFWVVILLLAAVHHL